MEDFAEIRKYIYAIFRWWWLIILFALMGSVIGFEISKRLPPVYQATTTIIVGQSMNATDLTKTDLQTSELLAQTYADIARRQPVLQGVIKALNLSSSERSLKKRIKIKQVSGTQLLEVSVEAGSPEEARITADEIARQLILQSPTAMRNEADTEKQQFIKQRLERLQIRIEDGQEQLKELEMQRTDSLSADELAELQKQIDTLENLIYDWDNSYTQLLILAESQQSPNRLAVIEPAQGSANPIRPQPRLHGLLASAVALLLAIGFVVTREFLDNTIQSAGDFSEYLGISLLGTIHHAEGDDLPDKLISNQNLFSPMAEAYRMIRSNIQFRTIDQPAKSIVVTSAVPGEGKSTTTANLGLVMAQNELKTVIVDCDLRRPTQHRIFQISNSMGLTDFLHAPQPNLEDYLKKTGVKNLYLLTCGVLPPNPSELLGSQRMGQLLAGLSEFADAIILDSPPVTAFTDAAVLSTRVDGVVLVIQAGQTRLDIARKATQNLQQVGAKLLGGVLNRVATKDESNYYQAYYSVEPANTRQQANSLTQFSGARRWRQWLPFGK